MSERVWGHEVRARTDEDMKRPSWWRDESPWNPPGCSHRKCGSLATHEGRYCYITGRAGRVTHRTPYYCEEHARAFAEKHGLQWPPTTEWPSRVRSGRDVTDSIVGGFIEAFKAGTER